MAENTITIMADFGMGPYAWIKSSSDKSSYVGSNISDTVTGFSGAADVSKQLEDDFATWVALFETHVDKPNFDWKDFHRHGIELSRRLKQEVGNAFDVVYVAPYEDPVEGRTLRVEISNNDVRS